MGDCVIVLDVEDSLEKGTKGIPDNMKSDGISPPPSKKMKQARLPFKPLNLKPPLAKPAVCTKKRKSDGAPGLQRMAKMSKNEEKLQKLPSIDDTQNEVSSSSEAENLAHMAENQKLAGSLERFLKRGHQVEVSTSCKDVDLTEADNEAEGRVIVKPSCETTANNNTDDNADSDLNNSVISSEASSANNSLNTTSESKGETNNDVEMVSPESVKSNSKKEEDAESDQVESGQDVLLVAPKQAELDTLKSPKPSGSSGKMTTPVSSSKKGKTPSKAERDLERQKKKEEKEKLKLEKDKQKEEREKAKQEEKEKKDKERLELKQKKEQEKKEKLEQKEKEKEEKLKQKEEEKRKKLEQKEEDKKAKEEEKKKKQELLELEKRKKKEELERKKEEERVKLEEEKIKQEMSKERNFMKGFFTKNTNQANNSKGEEKGRFLAFEVKKDMKLAPATRVDMDNLRLQEVDKHLDSQGTVPTYLEELKNRSIKLKLPARPVTKDDDDLIIVDSDSKKTKLGRMKVKRLQFKENNRPAYFGTWRKSSKKISARRPFTKDTVLFDYEVDSDDEWEEEEPGESLSHSEGGEDSDSDSDNDENEDDFFVPHGYLSEGEGCEDEEEDMSPEMMKARQLAKARAWDAEMKKKTEELQPCFCFSWWKPEMDSDPMIDRLKKFQAQYLVPGPISVTLKKKLSPAKNAKADHDQKRIKIQPVPEEAIPDLIRLVHGNMQSIQKLIKEFREYWRQKKTLDTPATVPTDNSHTLTETENNGSPTLKETGTPGTPKKKYTISKRQLDLKIKEIAVYEKRDDYKKLCWFVKQEIVDKYGLVDLPIPTKWCWLTRPNIEKKPEPAPTPSSGNECKSPVVKIKKFTRPNLPPRIGTSPISKVGTSARQQGAKTKIGTSPRQPGAMTKVGTSPRQPGANVKTSANKSDNPPRTSTRTIMQFAKPNMSPVLHLPSAQKPPAANSSLSSPISTTVVCSSSQSKNVPKPLKFPSQTKSSVISKEIRPGAKGQTPESEDSDDCLIVMEEKNQPTIQDLFSMKNKKKPKQQRPQPAMKPQQETAKTSSVVEAFDKNSCVEKANKECSGNLNKTVDLTDEMNQSVEMTEEPPRKNVPSSKETVGDISIITID